MYSDKYRDVQDIGKFHEYFKGSTLSKLTDVLHMALKIMLNHLKQHVIS